MDPQDQTFMTIHNLTPNANILFASDSIYDILGYLPEEVQGKSCFDYFHPDEVPFARHVHNQGVIMDKAAVLHYARIQAKDGQWVSCECCFTIVHDVLVACTSIYLGGEKSQRRAVEAPHVRRIFSSSPRDPRYHMLEHLSPKFRMPPVEREPRAALILNRFTMHLNIMYSTDAVTTILGMRPDEIKEKSFYECIQENCLPEAQRCLESAKANESIAYLRFWFRDPRTEEQRREAGVIDDEDVDDDAEDEGDGGNDSMGENTSDSESGGVRLNSVSSMDVDEEFPFERNEGRLNARANGHQAGAAAAAPAERQAARGLGRNRRRAPEAIELEAVVSCTSDGLVVILRRARPAIPSAHQPVAAPIRYENGLFAAPWGQNPIQPYVAPELLYNFRAPLMPQYMPLRENVKAAGGPPLDQLMRSIRDVAVFAWALVGINGKLAEYGHGLPQGRAQPDALPIWDPTAGDTGYEPPENMAARRWLPQQGKGKAAERPGEHHYRHAGYNHQPDGLPQYGSTRANTNILASLHSHGSDLENYTYGGGSSNWPRPVDTYGAPAGYGQHSYEPPAYQQPHYGQPSYEQHQDDRRGYGQPDYQQSNFDQPNYQNHSDPFSNGLVLPPIQSHNYDREPQPRHYAYGAPPPLLQPPVSTQPLSVTPSSQGSSSVMSQPHNPVPNGTVHQPYNGAGLPPPVPSSNATTQSRYIWQ